jgi:hypothetical protein
MRRTLVVCLSFALVACGGKDEADISNSLKETGTTELMEQVANDEYTAPEDGRMTEAQVQMYLKVREHEKKIAQVAKNEMKQHAEKAEAKGDKSIAGMVEGFKALGSAADFMTADIRAAKELGYNTQEYLWVKQQILEVSTAAMAEKFTETMSANFDKAYADVKKAYDEAKDEETKKVYADMLAGYDKSKQEMQTRQDENPALTFNKQLLTRYESALNAYAHELSKYEDKPGDVQKAVDELEKKTEEAKANQ